MAETAKFERSDAASAAPRGRDRRIYERFELSAAYGTLIYNGNGSKCQVLDISLGGCRVRTVSPFRAGALAQVELTLQTHGMILRILGITQWTTNQHEIGIRFTHPSLDSKNQLVGLLTCLVDQSVTEVVKAAIAAEAAVNPGAPMIALQPPAAHLVAMPQNKERAAPPRPRAAPTHDDEPWIKSAEKDAWPAVIRFLKDSHSLTGVMVELSLRQCRIRTPEPYSSGIHHRVEVDFRMRGLPFRMAGTIESIRDRRLVEVRFLELSSRKQDELAQLISELDEESDI